MPLSLPAGTASACPITSTVESPRAWNRTHALTVPVPTFRPILQLRESHNISRKRSTTRLFTRMPCLRRISRSRKPRSDGTPICETPAWRGRSFIFVSNSSSSEVNCSAGESNGFVAVDIEEVFGHRSWLRMRHVCELQHFGAAVVAIYQSLRIHDVRIASWLQTEGAASSEVWMSSISCNVRFAIKLFC